MKISKKALIISLVTMITLSGVTLLKVSAEGTAMTDQQIELIRANCLSTKNTLNQLHVSDALLRVNRGQIYESMSTKLMERFNGRVGANGLNNASLTAVTNSYGDQLNAFRADYIVYEQQLASAIKINCQNQPASFYDAVASARLKRTQVNADVIKLNQSLDQYQLSLNQFINDYQASNQGGN